MKHLSGPLFHKPKRRWKTYLFLLFLCSGFLVAGYFYYLDNQIHQRFESRRWSIPARVFSAPIPLYPGLAISHSQFKLMLDERRYRESLREPLPAGEYMASRDSIIVHFREFKFPGYSLPARRVQLDFNQNGISRIIGVQGDIAFLEMEPLELARLFGPSKESRLLVNIHEVKRTLIDAILAIEDHRFYEHGAIDLWGILRAFWADLRALRVVQGGSTITQQLVKNYFLEPERKLKRKIHEASMALLMEATYGKDEILEMYLNEIYLGQRGSVAVHGVGEAARYYFGRNIEDLTLSESATLAGMICGPNSFSPFTHPDATKERRNVVLKRMLDLGKISEYEYEHARREPLKTPGVLLPVNVAPYFVDYVRQQLQLLYAPEAIASEGLNIYTSLHSEISLAAESAVRDGLQELEEEYPHLIGTSLEESLQAALIAVHPKTGAVVALVGGRDFGESSFNRALHAYRQPGSAIKPFVYLTALDQFSPATWLSDEPSTFSVGSTTWSPKNYDERYRGRVTFRQALEESLNVPTVNLGLAIGLDNIVSKLRSLDIRSQLRPIPSLTLGAFELTPIDLVGAYATLDNDGQKPYLLSLKEVVSEKGEVQEKRNIDMVTVTTPAKAYLITDLLQGAMERGTGRSVKGAGIEFPCAGKTGTTNDYKDSWFAGFTTDLVVLVWVGFDDGRPTHLTGAQGAGRIWARFMNHIRPWIHPQDFKIPPGVVQRIICSASGQLATTGCSEKRLEVFLAEQAPKDYCSMHYGR